MSLNNFYPEGGPLQLEHVAAIYTVGNTYICVKGSLVFHLTSKTTG
jgi:hypothetical protein